MDMTTMNGHEAERARAVERLEAKRAFRGSLAVYLAVNALLVGVWATTGQGGFWPVWPLLGWGIGLVAKGWGAFGRRREIPEAAIQRELDLRAMTGGGRA